MDLKIVDNTPIQVELREQVEMKQAEEAEAAQQEEPEDNSKAAEQEDVEIDPDMRTCIVNTEEDPETFERVTINIFTKTIADLTQILKTELKKDGPHRIRNLQLNTLYAKEDELMLLKNFEQFVEGGARLTLESGHYCSIIETTLKILLEDKERHFNFNSEFNVGKCKTEICDAFDVNPNKYTLFRLDGFGEPAFQVRKEKATWSKNNVNSGDVLYLKSNSTITIDDKLSLSIHNTTFGLPDDCTFLQQIDVSKNLKLDEFKE